MSKSVFWFVLLAASAQAAPVHLQTNALNTPLGIDTPRLHSHGAATRLLRTGPNLPMRFSLTLS